ncbi:3-keto-5-aminohexanoate cleavage protein [Burkholderia territorii]|uniref:3-keto-5-aminohexanoate cleavage protein n=1 Tax=Burkholderia territorii TaxID=1503055 RepID=UPI001E3CD850|nr:3-keto-5-aminohexanoate cleavage protein [Burkholderia territorii]
MYITAAPTGAVPKRLDPLEPTFIPGYLMRDLLAPLDFSTIIEQLRLSGWEFVPAGGWRIESGHGQPISDESLRKLPNDAGARQALEEAGWTYIDQAWHAPRTSVVAAAKIPFEWFGFISSIDVVRRVVMQLTTYGWVANESGDLIWLHSKLHSYLPRALVGAIQEHGPEFLTKLETAGWQVCGEGYWQAGKGCSPWLPITPEAIADEALHSLNEGAAIVHLHTRELEDRVQFEIPGLGIITCGAQRNHIIVEHYDKIIPAIKRNDAAAILNVSTSVRGDRQGARSPLRRAHLKSYEDTFVPEFASLSPAPVIFRVGGGYDNAPDFLAAQFEHFGRVGTRPEVEVFNHAIVDNAVSLYRPHLERAGQPVLFMLVAGVDQYRRDPISGELEDDSLISQSIRQEMIRCVAIGDERERQSAVGLAVGQLAPVVDRLRKAFPASRISLLLPGSLQAMLADLALALMLDGVRIGLEDGLNVLDSHVPGGIRKARGTWEQVSKLRDDLLARGIAVQTAAEVRDMLGLPLARLNQVRMKRA